MMRSKEDTNRRGLEHSFLTAIMVEHLSFAEARPGRVEKQTSSIGPLKDPRKVSRILIPRFFASRPEQSRPSGKPCDENCPYD